MKIKEMSEVLNGYAFKSSNYINEGYRVIRITNVQSGYIEDEKPVYYEFDNKLEKYKLKENDLLISLTGNVGRCALVTKDFLPAYLNQRVCCLRINKEKVIPKFLYYILNSKKFEFDCINSSQGIAQLNMSTEWLKEYNLEIPAIELQKKIINIFDKVYNNINIKKNQINSCNNLIKSQFVEMFGDFNNSKYKKTKLDKIANIGSSHRVFTNEFVDNGIPFYRGTEITMLANGVKPKECFYISKEHYEKICSDKTKPKINDLLMPSICDKGQIWLVNTDEPFYYKDGRVLSISLKTSNINPKYLHYYMKNKTIEEYPKLGSGSTFAEFKIFLLKDVDVIVPPIELQNKFANIAEQIDKQKFEFEKSLKKLEELQASLMQEYFG